MLDEQTHGALVYWSDLLLVELQMIETKRRKRARGDALQFWDYERIELSFQILILCQGRLLAQLLVELEQNLTQHFTQCDQKNPVLNHDYEIVREIST
jgi:hypothetical protein